MEAGTLFQIRNDSRLQVEQLMEAIKLHKDEVWGFVYDDAQTLVTQIKLGIKQQLFK